jgi:hypothetical protein
MSRNNFDPRSPQQDERPIVRNQFDFKAGLFNDMPASNIPINGVSELKNFINFGDSLTGRSGTKQWSQSVIPDKSSGLSITSTVSSGQRTVIDPLAAGTFFSFDDIGNWIVFSDDSIEKIVDYTDNDTVVTTTSSADNAVADADTVGIRGHLNAAMFHKGNKRIVIHVDNRILIADDINCSGWTECIRNSIVKPSNNTSMFDEFENFAVLCNSNGIFKINLDQEPPIYFRTNINVPNAKITSTGAQSTTTPYGYKYVYSLSRIPGFGNRNRQSPGAIIEMETGSNIADDNYQDYGLVWSASGVSSGNSLTIGSLTNSVDPITPTNINQEATHYTLYRSLDVGVNGTDPIGGAGNNPEQLIWVEDVPVAKAFTVTVSGTTCTNTIGTFDATDIGSIISIYDGVNSYNRTIDSGLSSTVVTLSSSLPSGATSQPANIGGATSLSLSQSGDVVSVEASGLSVFASGDVGKTLYWTDGDYGVVKSFTDSGTVIVHNSDTKATQGACMDPTSRQYRDIMQDDPATGEAYNIDQLRVRIGSYLLQQRFWQSLPNSNIGVIVPGFMFVAPRNSKYMYYSQMPVGYEYLMGYYKPDVQFTRFKDAINNMVEFPNTLIVRCNTSTYDLPLNTFETIRDDSTGEAYLVISSQNVLDESVGSTDFGGSVKTDEGVEIVITNEPAIRLFDGQKYSENLATDRIMKQLQKMNAVYAASYDPINGLIFWGSDA